MLRNNLTRILSDKPELANNGELKENVDDLDALDAVSALVGTDVGNALIKYHKKRIVSYVLDIIDLASKGDVVKLQHTVAKLDAELSMTKYLTTARSQADALQQAIDELLKDN